MTAVAAVLELALCIALAGAGAVVAITGRRMAPGISNWPREGGPLRLFGAAAVLVAALLGRLVWRVGASWEGVIAGYFWATIAVATAIHRSGEQSSSRF